MMGRAMVAGGCMGMKVPGGVQAGSLSVGSVVKLMEDSTAVEYLVVNQGIPGNSSLYDDSCDGTWLLRKYLYTNYQWADVDENVYENSAICTYLEARVFNGLGSAEQALVKQVKIPYCTGNGGSTVKGGASGLSCKVFLLSGYECGFTKSDDSYFPIDGAKLDYFTTGSGGNSKRIAYQNGAADRWWTRSPYTDDDAKVWNVTSAGACDSGYYASRSFGIRPALILPQTALFDADTLILKGVA